MEMSEILPQPLKVRAPILVTLPTITALLSFLQLENALSLITDTLTGIERSIVQPGVY